MLTLYGSQSMCSRVMISGMLGSKRPTIVWAEWPVLHWSRIMSRF